MKYITKIEIEENCRLPNYGYTETKEFEKKEEAQYYAKNKYKELHWSWRVRRYSIQVQN